MNYWSRRIIADPKTGNRVVFAGRDVTEIITIREDPFISKGPIDHNYCNYGYCDERFLDDFIEGYPDVPCYLGSGKCSSPEKFGLECFFRYTRALTHKDLYFKNSIDLKKRDICVIWNWGQSQGETLALENYDIILRRKAGLEFTKYGTTVWDRESLMNKKYVYNINKQLWRDKCELYGISI